MSLHGNDAVALTTLMSRQYRNGLSFNARISSISDKSLAAAHLHILDLSAGSAGTVFTAVCLAVYQQETQSYRRTDEFWEHVTHEPE